MGLFERNRQKVTYIFFLVFIPNFLFVSASLFFELGRPWVNLDYLFAAVIFTFGYRFLASIFLVVAVFIDVLGLIGQIYPFVRVYDLLYLSKFIFLSSFKSQVYIFSGLALVFVVFFGLAKASGKERKLSALVLFNLAVALYTFNVYGNANERNEYWRVTDRPVVSSQMVSFYEYRSRGFVETFYLTGEAFVRTGFQGGTEGWEGDLDDLADKLLLVVNESWGVSNSAEAQAAIVSPITELQDRFEVKLYHELPFMGATVAGELRELCGLRPNHFNLAPVVDGYEDCLPNRLVGLGYSTYAIHGAVGLMYDRHLWYPRVGFQDMTFFEAKSWPNRCYSFPGACDIDLAHEVRRKLKEGGKKFVYWLILNTHNFYDPRDIKLDVFDCQAFDIEDGSEACRSMKLQAQFFHSLSEILVDPELSGVEVIVVGDHAPPIFNAAEKERYFKESKISLLNFIVK